MKTRMALDTDQSYYVGILYNVSLQNGVECSGHCGTQWVWITAGEQPSRLLASTGIMTKEDEKERKLYLLLGTRYFLCTKIVIIIMTAKLSKHLLCASLVEKAP